MIMSAQNCDAKMGKNNANNEDYVTLKLPRALADEIDHVIESGTLGYRSRAELVSDAVRRRLEQLSPNNMNRNNSLNRSRKE
jgi:metal-responsive CopG/Arc/MetJ family transcriptional regulator